MAEQVSEATAGNAEANALDDNEFEARLRDPSLIATHEEAVAILEELDEEIAHIQMQIDAYSIESNGREMPPNRQAWLRRAAYAGAMQRNHRHRVIQRDKELRGTKYTAHTSQKDPTLGLAKQQRLSLEAQVKREAAAVKRERNRIALEDMAERRSFARTFVRSAKDLLTDNDFQAVSNMAKRRMTEENG